MSFDQTLAALQRGIDEGLHAGAQICVIHRGQLVLDEAVGVARSGVDMARDTINLWMSCTKPIVAVAVLMLCDRGKLNLDDRVVQYISQFGQCGKESITIRHLLTHTGGFRGTSQGFLMEPWDRIIAQVCGLRLETGWIPGQKAGYHPSSSWYILGELVRVIDGRTFNQFVRQEILEPLGMRDSWIGIPGEKYHGYGERVGSFWNATQDPRQAVAPPSAELCALPSPSANGRGPVRELALFYAGLPRLLGPDTLKAATSRQREGMFDHTFGQVMDWGLGFMINSIRYGKDVPYQYGRFASEGAFGHSGNQSSCAFCDAEIDLFVAWMCNAMCGEEKHQQRQREINEAIYQDIS